MSASEFQSGVIESELLGSLPRRARYTGSTKTIRLIAFVLLAGGIGLIAWLASRDLADLTALAARGVKTSATITAMQVHSGKTTTYEVDYIFMAGVVMVSSSDDVTYADYQAKDVGESLLVTYLPEHPTTERVGIVDQARVSREQDVWAVILLFVLLILGGMSWCFETFYRSHLQLLKSGVAVAGQVTDRNIIKGKNTVYYISYEFPGPGGTHKNTIMVSSDIYSACDPGMAMTVLYNPTRPGRNRLYRALNDVTVS